MSSRLRYSRSKIYLVFHIVVASKFQNPTQIRIRDAVPSRTCNAPFFVPSLFPYGTFWLARSESVVSRFQEAAREQKTTDYVSRSGKRR